ncbi:unnamed protein product, partial [marine sediment metagenome]
IIFAGVDYDEGILCHLVVGQIGQAYFNAFSYSNHNTKPPILII